MDSIYIAGPMRGIAMYNFPAFDAAADALKAAGWNVINPAAIDRSFGFDPAFECDESFLRQALLRDVNAILHQADAMALLPGWEQSTGALAEYHLAKWCKLPCYRYPEMVVVGEECILDVAKRITSTERQQSYGHPKDNFRVIASLWSALKGVEFTEQDVALFNIAQKMSRQIVADKVDNWVDIAGYAKAGSLL